MRKCSLLHKVYGAVQQVALFQRLEINCSFTECINAENSIQTRSALYISLYWKGQTEISYLEMTAARWIKVSWYGKLHKVKNIIQRLSIDNWIGNSGQTIEVFKLPKDRTWTSPKFKAEPGNNGQYWIQNILIGRLFVPFYDTNQAWN